VRQVRIDDDRLALQLLGALGDVVGVRGGGNREARKSDGQAHVAGAYSGSQPSTDVIAGAAPTRHDHHVRWLLLVSLAFHVALLMVLVSGHKPIAPRATLVSGQVEEPAPMVVEMLEPTGGGGGHGGGHSAAGDDAGSPARAVPTTGIVRIASTRAAHAAPPRARSTERSTDGWAGLSIRTESQGDGAGTGNGNGIGAGTGNGIGFGNGGGVHVERDVPPPPPPPPPPSMARKAKLIWPMRDLDVEDESALFVAKVTVDTDGSVVGARMLTSRPGSRAQHAANAIWTFRYAPALGDDGAPIRSTFEQSFQIR